MIEAWTTDPSKQVMLASTTVSSSQLQLPAGSDNTSSVNVVVHIRDMLNGVTQFNMQSVIVVPDVAAIATLVNVLQQSNIEAINTNPIIRLLAGGNHNTVGQVLTSLSQVFNEMNIQSVETAVTSNCISGCLQKIV
jgi:hypothetical protein